MVGEIPTVATALEEQVVDQVNNSRVPHVVFLGILAASMMIGKAVQHVSDSASTPVHAVAVAPRMNPSSASAADNERTVMVQNRVRADIHERLQAKLAQAALLKKLSTPPYSWKLEAYLANADGKYNRLAQCESSGRWWLPRGGGLGNLHWSTSREPGMAATVGQAPPYEQIVAAENIRWGIRPYGSFRAGKWGCAIKAGLQ